MLIPVLVCRCGDVRKRTRILDKIMIQIGNCDESKVVSETSNESDLVKKVLHHSHFQCFLNLVIFENEIFTGDGL